MRRVAVTLVTVVAAAGFSGCQAVQSDGPHSVVQDLANDRNSQNIAVLYGAPTNLTGIDLDLALVKGVLEDSDARSGFKVQSWYRISAEQILAETAKAAVAVGDTGTLFWYFSGHGAASGELLGEPGYVNFDKVTAAIKAQRSKPLKRFVVVVDACFSGNLVDGRVAIARDETTSSTYSEADLETRALESLADEVAVAITDAVGEDEYSTDKLAEELLVITASDRLTTSLATQNGSTFTQAFSKAYKQLKARSDAKLSDFVETTSRYTLSLSGQHHKPAVKAVPQSLLEQPLLTRGSDPATGGASITPAADVWLALGEPDSAGAVVPHVSFSGAIATATWCASSVLACIDNPAARRMSVERNLSGDRRVFVTDGGVAAAANTTYAMLGFDAAGKLVAARAVTMEPR